MPTIEIYKRNQGKWTRTCTFASAVGIAAIGAFLLSHSLYGYSAFLRFGLPVFLVLAGAAVMFWVVNRASTADFLIATEGEMKKVSWSSRKEVIGSTKVVIVTAIIVSMTLYAVDMLFILLFQTIGVMGV